jgi:hypothetical protein
MRWLLFLSRLCFICGLFIILAISLRMRDWLPNETIVSTIGVLYFLGLIIVPITNLCYLVVLLVRRKLAVYVPGWLIAANVLFLFALLYYIFYLDDPYYHQT